MTFTRFFITSSSPTSIVPYEICINLSFIDSFLAFRTLLRYSVVNLQLKRAKARFFAHGHVARGCGRRRIGGLKPLSPSREGLDEVMTT